MHVCVVAHIFPARSETFVSQHVLGLRRRGHEVTVLAKGSDRSISSDELQVFDKIGVKRVYVGEYPRPKINWLLTLFNAIGTVKLKTLMAPGVHDLRQRYLIARALGRRIMQLDPDVLHIHFGTIADDVMGDEYGVNFASRTVVTWHGYEFNSRSVVTAHKGYSALRDRHVAHTVGTRFSADKLAGFGIPWPSIRKIPMGIDLAKFSFKKRDYTDTSIFRVLSVGRMVEVKGHIYLIRAIGEARMLGVPVHLRIIGDGPLRAQLESVVAQLELGRHVEFLGALPSASVLDEMNQADIFALAGIEEQGGKVENQGTVYCEAAATGLPAIGSRAGGVPEAVIHDVTGKLCRPGDHLDVAAALQYLHRHRVVTSQFGKNARRHAEANFSLERMLDDFETLYTELAEKK